MNNEIQRKHLRLKVNNHVGWLQFNRPKVNAFNIEMVQEVIDSLDQFELDASVRVIVFASALDKHFSAGAEINTFINIGEDGMASLCKMLHDIVYRIRKSKKPMLAAIHGMAVGGGIPDADFSGALPLVCRATHKKSRSHNSFRAINPSSRNSRPGPHGPWIGS